MAPTNWTQPICEYCFHNHEPGRQPVRLRVPAEETCCVCGVQTADGIYIRIDPTTVKYPT